MSSELKVGSLYSGYDGLGMAIRRVSSRPVRMLWHCDPDPDCAATLEKHHPDVPNLGSDVTPDWTTVEQPDIVTLGPPCQPASAAGMMLGADDPRWRWPYAHRALLALRPPVLLFENVANLCAKGRMWPLWQGILADMHAMGYAIAWTVLGACAVGAPHHRHRLFAVGRLRPVAGPPLRYGEKAICPGRVPLLASPMARDRDPNQRGEGSPEYWARRLAKRENQGIPLGAQVLALLPTPRASDAANGGPSQGISSGDIALSSAVHVERWGRYAEAVARWEGIVGRSAPAPTELTGRGNGARLAPALPEWMMGLPAGHLTGHLSRPAALRLAGNGVCPQQAAAAFRLLWPTV